METATLKRKDAPAAPPSVEPASSEAKRQPVAILREDDCSASIWMRTSTRNGSSRKYYSVTFAQSYKDRGGDWKYTQTFTAESLNRLQSLCQQAAEAIADLKQHEAC